MAYATVQDMVTRFGANELIRLTTPADQALDGIVTAVADTALNSASVMMDSFIGRRYKTPMDLPPPVVTDMCCDIARFRLSTGDQKTPSEEVRARHKDAMSWLESVSKGLVVLELDEVAPGDESYAEVQTREAAPFGGNGW